jgi:hypothetical protein
MARPEGLEPPTFGFEDRCSIQLSYGRTIFSIAWLEKFGGSHKPFEFDSNTENDHLASNQRVGSSNLSGRSPIRTHFSRTFTAPPEKSFTEVVCSDDDPAKPQN